MEINLIIPPISDCFMPTLGAAQIAGYLKSNQVACRVYDAGAELMKILFEEGNGKQEELQRLLGDGSYTYRNIAACFHLFSITHSDIRITMDGLRTDFQWQETSRLLKYIEKEKELSEELKKLTFLSGACPVGESCYGISVSYDCQVIPALLLARLIKERDPRAKIGIGGSLLYNYEQVFYQLMYGSELIDILIVGAGEEVWKYIGRDQAERLAEIPDIRVREMQGRYIIDTRDMRRKPIVYDPDFSDIHFEYYPSEEKAFPYMVKDRCYYGQCYFCNGDKVESQTSAKDIGKAFLKMQKIAEQIGIYNVYIVDAALSPKDFKHISELPEEIRIHWIANARFEKGLKDEALVLQMAKRGCRMLRFGLESASQRVLDLMHKGTDVADAEKILRLTARCGIKNHVYIMFGYPGETREDRELTLGFLKRNREIISSYSVSVFQPIPGTKVYQELLREIGDGENVYERMIARLYPDEAYYAELYEDISRLNDLLRGYAETNVEYYSANIFNRSDVRRACPKRKNLLIEKERLAEMLGTEPNFEGHVWVYEKGIRRDVISKEFVVADLYRNFMMHLQVSDGMMRRIADWLDSDRDLAADSEEEEEFFYLWDKYIEARPFRDAAERELKCFEVLTAERDISREISIQFSPESENWQEG